MQKVEYIEELKHSVKRQISKY